MRHSKHNSTVISLLYADDDAVSRNIFHVLLSNKFPGIELHMAENGSIGLNLYKQHMPQIVITDISMPVMDGILMAREIKATDPETIIIAVTAHCDEQYLMDAIEIGINHYVMKPVDHQKLISLIEKCIAGINLEWQVREQESEIKRLSSFPQLNPNPILEIDADSKVTFRNMAALKIEAKAGYRGTTSPFIPEDLQKNIRLMQEKGTGQHEQEIEIAGEIYAEHIHLVPQFNTIRIYATNITERKRAEMELRKSEELHRLLSITDSLTGLYNSRHFFSQIEIEVERAKRYGHPLSLLLLDIDNFKKFNDTYGHLEGNNVLAVLAEIIRDNLRNTDTAYRYGGEEFTAILPETESESALIVAERIRSYFENAELSPLQGSKVHVTASIGVGCYIAEEPVSSFIKRTDRYMYMAKELGKNRIYHAVLPEGARFSSIRNSACPK